MKKTFDRQDRILAIDLGTSACKVALADLQGKIFAHEVEPMQVIFLPDGGAEQNPDEWWKGIQKATHRLIKNSRINPQKIVAVCCTAQWSGTVPVDRKGRPLMKAIIWMDSRGEPYIRQVIGGAISIEGYAPLKLWRWIRLTGGAPTQSGKDSIAHILYIKNKHPEIYADTYKFLEPKDYLNLKLTGKFASSGESMALHWVTDNRDLQRIHYHERLLNILDIDRDKLPDLYRSVDILGPICPEAAEALGISKEAQVVLGTPDVQSAALGSGAVGDFEPHLYIGTSSWLTCHVPFKKTDLLHNMASLPSAIPDKYFVANEQETAGACLNFLKDQVFFHDDALDTALSSNNIYQKFDQIVERTKPGSEGVIFTPWLYGERTPVDDRFVRGGFYNLSLKTTREHLIRAVYEGVALNSRWLLHYVEKFIKRRLDRIHMIGGGANSEIWCQIHADILNRTIVQVKNPIEANVRGVAILASVALGSGSFEELGRRVEIAGTFSPDSRNRKIYDFLFKKFVQIYSRNKKIYRSLNKTDSIV